MEEVAPFGFLVRKRLFKNDILDLSNEELLFKAKTKGFIGERYVISDLKRDVKIHAYRNSWSENEWTIIRKKQEIALLSLKPEKRFLVYFVLEDLTENRFLFSKAESSLLYKFIDEDEMEAFSFDSSRDKTLKNVVVEVKEEFDPLTALITSLIIIKILQRAEKETRGVFLCY